MRQRPDCPACHAPLDPDEVLDRCLCCGEPLTVAGAVEELVGY